MTYMWGKSLGEIYADGIDALETALRACPDDLWGASMWEVKLTDRHVWPIVRGIGAELPDAERLQLHSAFWFIAYHAIFFLDHYLGGGLGEPTPPQPFRAADHQPHALPHRVYTRDELLSYVDHCRRKAESVLGALTEEEAQRPARIGRPFADLLIRNAVQLHEHTGQFNLFLNTRGGWSDPRWSVNDRWFRRCPDCADDAQ